jgi:D-3-phosphoglycerate dehydrogenase / 2-oxoglutarate reductase
MKILVCDQTEETAIDKIRSAGIEVDIKDQITQDELIQTISGYDGMIVRSRTKVTSSVIQSGVNLKLIVRGGVGLDTIDTVTASAKGITVFNTPLASSSAVAELTVGYIFALARFLPQATNSMKKGLWEKKRFEGIEISGKKLGIIGIGNIGKEVAWRARAIGMSVQSYDPYANSPLGVIPVSFDEIISTSDFLTFHLPLTPNTKNMISFTEFEKMKPGVRIINCARGGIIDEQALYDSIKNGKVSGAALDVFSSEPAINHPLFSLENVIGSPHIGASTQEAQSRIGDEVADIIIRFFKG